jgi:hypothetical protein
MKRTLFLIALIAAFSIQIHAQSVYQKARDKIEGMGYTISKEMEVNISEGQTGYSYKTFYEGLTYIIYAMSEDRDVSDIDIYVYDTSDDEILKRDAEDDDVAVVSFTPNRDIEGKVVIKNYKSSDPNYESRCRYIIAYKSE